MPCICFPCLLDRGRKRCCPLGGACLFPVPGGVRDLLGGASQSLWYCEGPSCCVTAFQQSCSGMQRGEESAVLGEYFAQTKLGGGGGGSIQIACSGCVLLLSYPLMPLPNLLAVIFHGMSFHPISGHAATAQGSLCSAGVLYLNAVKSIVATACV